MQANEIQLHDIKPLMEIQEYSLYYFIALCIVGLLIVIAFIYLLSLWMKKKNQFNIKKEHLKLLQNIDFSDAKKAAYDISFYGATFKYDTPELTELYQNLQDKLESYKYKKDVESFDETSISVYKTYLEAIDVK